MLWTFRSLFYRTIFRVEIVRVSAVTRCYRHHGPVRELQATSAKRYSGGFFEERAHILSIQRVISTPVMFVLYFLFSYAISRIAQSATARNTIKGISICAVALVIEVLIHSFNSLLEVMCRLD